PLQRLTDRFSQLRLWWLFGEPLLQERGDDRGVGTRALLGEEDPEHRLLQRRRALQAIYAVVAQHADEAAAEGVRQSGTLGMKALQVGMEVLARAVQPRLRRVLLAHRPVPAELGEVGKDLEKPEFGRERTAR